MGDGPKPSGRQQHTYELARRAPETESEPSRASRRRLRLPALPLAAAARGLTYALIAAVALGAWQLLPEAGPVPLEGSQELGTSTGSAPPTQASAAAIRDARAPLPSKERKHGMNRSRRSGRPRGTHVTFSLGTGSAGSSSPAPTTPHGSDDSATAPAKKKHKKPSKPTGPVPTLEFRRIVKEKSGNHYHAVDDAEIQARLDRGFEMRETIGYLFDSQIEGTRMLAIDEGVMGWIHEKDQGRSTVPLYRLTGPEYHDYEVIFTSSEDVRTYWEGNGWRVTRIEGYIVTSP